MFDPLMHGTIGAIQLHYARWELLCNDCQNLIYRMQRDAMLAPALRAMTSEEQRAKLRAEYVGGPPRAVEVPDRVTLEKRTEGTV